MVGNSLAFRFVAQCAASASVVLLLLCCFIRLLHFGIGTLTCHTAAALSWAPALPSAHFFHSSFCIPMKYPQASVSTRLLVLPSLASRWCALRVQACKRSAASWSVSPCLLATTHLVTAPTLQHSPAASPHMCAALPCVFFQDCSQPLSIFPSRLLAASAGRQLRSTPQNLQPPV